MALLNESILSSIFLNSSSSFWIIFILAFSSCIFDNLSFTLLYKELTFFPFSFSSNNELSSLSFSSEVSSSSESSSLFPFSSLKCAFLSLFLFFFPFLSLSSFSPFSPFFFFLCFFYF